MQPGFAHDNLNVGATYYYTVIAIDSNGEGLPSAIAGAIPVGGVITNNFTDTQLQLCVEQWANANAWQHLCYLRRTDYADRYIGSCCY